MPEFVKLLFSYLFDAAIPALIGAAVAWGGVTCYNIMSTKKDAPKISRLRGWGMVALAAYLAVVLSVTVLQRSPEPTGSMGYVNYHLFLAWREAWNQFTLRTWLNIFLNIALFVPLGALLPLLWRRLRKWYLVFGIGLGFCLALETVQFFTGRGLADVDDVFTNCLGTMLGYWCVMIFLAPGKGRLWYLLGPGAFILAMAVLFGGYAVQDYGNLPGAPVYRFSTKGFTWDLQCDLTGPETAQVYYFTPPDHTACDAIAQGFEEKLGIDREKTEHFDWEYYDDGAWYSDHRGYDLYIYYIDGSYDLRCRPPDLDASETGTQETREDLLAQLAKLGIDLPETAEMTYEGDGRHSFTVPPTVTGTEAVTGALECTVQAGIVTRVESSLVRLTPYREAAILSPQEAYEKLTRGDFGGNYWLSGDRTSAAVTAWELGYRPDTKGYYQPVYLFHLVLEGGAETEAMVPALK